MLEFQPNYSITKVMIMTVISAVVKDEYSVTISFTQCFSYFHSPFRITANYYTLLIFTASEMSLI